MNGKPLLHQISASAVRDICPGPAAGAVWPGRQHGPGGQPRGVLLLLVLSMLSLFMVLGIMFVVMSSRARTMARALANTTLSAAEATLPTDRLLDHAAMLLIRGPQASTAADRQPAALGLPEAANPPGEEPAEDPTRALVFESLLVDQYGTTPPLEAELVEIADAGPVCTLTIDFPESAEFALAELSGRVLSLLPVGAAATSHRILRAQAGDEHPEGKNRIRLCVSHLGPQFPRSADGRVFVLPSAGTKVIVSSRAHSSPGAARNESWDGFDDANPFLAHVEPDPAAPSRQIVFRPSMFKVEAAAGLNDEDESDDDLDGDKVDDRADNDNDGVFDGWFFDPGLPEIVSPRTGLPIAIHMSCLIVDMDGRLNVNAHGSVNDLLSRADVVPFGSGYGPAEIDGGAVFRSLAASSGDSCSDNPWMNLLLGARAGSTLYSGSAPRPGDRLMPLQYADGTALEGRYGWKGNADSTPIGGVGSRDRLGLVVPMPGFNDRADEVAADGILNLAAVPAANRSWAVDLHGRLQTRANRDQNPAKAPVPTLTYAKADVSDEFLDQPYEISLDYRRRRTGLHDPGTSGTEVSLVADNPFSPAEFERVLRPYDPDSPTLPERLSGLLGSQAEAARMVVTTDGWDTPNIVGEAAQRIYDWFSAVPTAVLHEHFATAGEWAEVERGERLPNNLIPAEFAAGLRMDVARPVGGSAGQRRLFFKDLYMAAVALSVPAGENPSAEVARNCGQWAANVIEYQDADSTMTRFEYDLRPLDGWDVDGDPLTAETDSGTAWGAERPEVVITQTLAWDEKEKQDGEGEDEDEDEHENGDEENEGGTAAGRKQGELYVVLHHPWDGRLGTGQPGSAEPVDPNLAGPEGPGYVDLGRKTPSGSGIWRLRCGDTFSFPVVGTSLGANQWLFLKPEGPSKKGVQVPGSDSTRLIASIPGLQARLPEQTGEGMLAPRSTWVSLERLADPRAPHDARLNPYLIVDALAVFVADRTEKDDDKADDDEGKQDDGEAGGDSETAEPEARSPDEQFTACRRNSGWAQQHEERKFEEDQTPAMTAEWEGDPRWFSWPNRPLASPAELILVPGFTSLKVNDETYSGDKGMLYDYVADPDDGIYLPDIIPGDKLVALEVFTVPSRFAGSRQTVDRSARYWDALKEMHVGFYGDINSQVKAPFEHNELSTGREPGRVNLNTITSDAVWEAVVQGTVPRISDADPVQPPYGLVRGRTSGTSPSDAGFAELVSTGSAGTLNPAKTTGQLLSLSGVNERPTLVINGSSSIPDAAINPAHAFHTAMRLSNIATNRSHIFGIWITLRTMETTADGGVDRDSVGFQRMFLLFDRSQPLAFESGLDHNVRDGIILQRVLH